MPSLLHLLIIGCCLVNTLSGNLPSFITPCSKSDPELSQCLTSTMQKVIPVFSKGIPELGVEPMDPLRLETVTCDNPALKLTFTDAYLVGLKNSKVNYFKMDSENTLFDLVANVTLKGHYLLDGQVLIMSINGNGQAKVKITNLHLLVKFNYINENDHWNITGFEHSYKMDRAQFKFNNLYGGKNVMLADLTTRFTNQNWPLIMESIAPPAIEQIIKKSIGEIRKFFAAVPEHELFKP